MRVELLFLVTVLLLVGCSGSQKGLDPAGLSNQSQRLANDDYKVELSWARPLVTSELTQIYNTNMLPFISQSGQVNILDTANYIKKSGDSISLYLPYFGTRQMSVNPSDSNSAIRYSGTPEDYSVIIDERRNISLVTFGFGQGTERFNLAIQVYGDNSIQVNLNGSHRTTISYRGHLKWQAGQE